MSRTNRTNRTNCTRKKKLTKEQIEILVYCKPHLQQMWAAYITSIILGCDFQDTPREIQLYERELAS